MYFFVTFNSRTSLSKSTWQQHTKKCSELRLLTYFVFKSTWQRHKKRSSEYQLLLKLQVERSLWAKIGAQTPNLQGAITHTWHVCSQHSFELPLRVNGEHKTQVTRSRTFGPSIDVSLIT